MLALVNTPRGPAPIELREIPEPALANNEALIEVHAFSLNRGELSSFARNKEGWVPGQDVAGIVLRQAANGVGPSVGANVVALVDDFGWAQRAAVASHRMAVLPGNVSFAQAATLPVAGLTALRTLRHGGALVGRRVLITGAAGGVGTLAVQMAAHSGAHVTAVVGGPARAAGLQGLGNRSGRGHRQRSRQVRAHLGIGRGRLAGGRDKACRAKWDRCGVRQLFQPTDNDQFHGFPRSGERSHTKLQLFHLGSGGAIRTGPRAAGVTDRGRIAEAADRRGAELARHP
jgi:D-arabinose 1-dehydrogenase-like Zn-dependent alcohol dehydrogenase